MQNIIWRSFEKSEGMCYSKITVAERQRCFAVQTLAGQQIYSGCRVFYEQGARKEESRLKPDSSRAAGRMDKSLLPD